MSVLPLSWISHPTVILIFNEHNIAYCIIKIKITVIHKSAFIHNNIWQMLAPSEPSYKNHYKTKNTENFHFLSYFIKWLRNTTYHNFHLFPDREMYSCTLAWNSTLSFLYCSAASIFSGSSKFSKSWKDSNTVRSCRMWCDNIW